MKKIHLKKIYFGFNFYKSVRQKKIFFFLLKKINNYRVKYDF